jgi:hypothetical protein
VAPWIDDFTVEYLAFPNGKHDDQIDALSQFLNWQGNRVPPSPFSFEFLDVGTYCGGGPVLGAPAPEDILNLRFR